MSIKRTIITAIAALALVAVVAPAVTQADQVSDLMAQLAQLQAQLNSLQGTSTPAATATGACAGVTFTRNLKVGSTGSDVKCLQQTLSVTPMSGYFGPITLAAVKTWQAANGITPANQVGPMSRAKLNALLTTTPSNGGNTTTTGPVSAVLSFDNPASGALIGSQAAADLLHVNFTGNGTITSVTLQRSGISTQTTLSAVYLYDGATRLTDGYSFNANGTLTMGGLSIPVSGSKVISVKADTAAYDATASSVVVSLTGFTANGTTATANVTGNVFSIVPGSAATAYMTTNTAAATATVNGGTTQYPMWSDTIQVNTRTVQLKGINFKMIGSAPTNALSNIKLYVDGVDAGTVATIGSIQGSNYAMFNLATPVSLITGTHTIEVRADIVTGANRTIQLSVQQAADVTITDPQVGVNIAIQASNGVSFVADNGTTVTIATGSSTIVIDPTFNSQTNITAGTTNALIGKFIIHGYGEDVKINSLDVTPALAGATPTAAGLQNVTLYFNGSQVGAQKAWTSGTLTYTLGSQMIIPAGQDSTLEVRADLQTSGGVNYTAGTVSVTIEGSSSNNNALGQNSSEVIDFPGADVATSGLSISSASLAVSKNTALANYTAAPNTSDVKIGSFVVQNQSTSEAVRLTTLTVDLTSNGTTALTSTELGGLASLRTSLNTANPIAPAASNIFSINEVLQPNTSKVIDIYANVGSSSLITAVVTKLTVASIGVSSQVTDAGSAKTGQTVSFGTGTVTTPTVVSSGSLSAQYLPSSVESPANGVTYATFRFVSTSAASTISELKFTVTGSDANPTQTVTSVCVDSICGSPVVSSGTQQVYLSGLNIAVPTSGVTKQVKVSFAGVGTGGVTPNKTATVTLTYVKYTSGGTPATITPSVSGNAMTLVGSRPTVVVASGNATGMSLNTSTKVGQVTISADAKGDIKVRQLNFAIGYSGYSTSPTSIASAFLALGGQSTAISNSLCTIAGTTTNVVCRFGESGTAPVDGDAFTYANDFTIGKGESQQFDLYITTAGGQNTGTNKAQITSSLYAGASSASGTASTTSSFLWDDASTNGDSATGLTNTLVSGFPTNAYSVSQ